MPERMTGLPMSKMLRSKQMCEKVGCTYRQLDYWISKGYLRPWTIVGEPGSGSVRIFHPEQVAEVRRLKREVAKKAGHQLSKMRKVEGR